MIRMECQGNKRLEAAGFILQLPQPAEVVDAVSSMLDVAVQHGGIGTQAELMGFAVNANPSVGIRLVLANAVAHLGMEDLGPAARQAAQPGLLEFGEDVAGLPSGQASKPIPLASCVSFY